MQALMTDPMESNALNKTLLLALFLLLSFIILIYGQVIHFDFLTFDDPRAITENDFVKSGLSLESIKWAFGFNCIDYWYPATWISHMAAFQLWGMNSAAHHMMNVILHFFNSVLLFGLLFTMTRCRWQSLLAALIFAIHPLNVESVAWVTERKNTLSLFWGLLSLLFYARFVLSHKRKLYFSSCVCYGLSLMAKPIFVTMPFILILFDIWPLKRYSKDALESSSNKLHRLIYKQAIAEKLPFYALTLASIVVTLLSIKSCPRMIIPGDTFPVWLRIENFMVATCKYVLKTIWPTDLIIYYPFQTHYSVWLLVASLVTLSAIPILALICFRRFPYLLIGWLFFFGTLLPMSGIIRSGMWPEMADRFTYLPIIGLCIIFAWAAADFFSISRGALIVGLLLVGLVVAGLATKANKQVGYWRDSITLFSHAVAIMPVNLIARHNLGDALSRAGRLEKAVKQYNAALQINPQYPLSLMNMGLTLLNQGRPKEAAVFIDKLLDLDPDNPKALRLKGYALYKQGGKAAAAAEYYRRALKCDPNDSETHFWMGIVQNELNNAILAETHYREAIKLDPEFTDARINLGNLLYRSGRIDLAKNAYRGIIAYDPNNPDAISKLGVVAAREGKIAQALLLFEKALRIQPDNPDARRGIETIKKAIQSETPEAG